MKIYTRTGDQGETALFGGKRVAKNDPRIEAYGTVDELNSFVGLTRTHRLPPEIEAELAVVQCDLFDLGARLASPGLDRFKGVDPARIEQLETAIDAMESELPALTTFILPGGKRSAALLHACRTICRRAERCTVALESEEEAVRYLNRLSDYLFVAARFSNRYDGGVDVPWSGR